MCEDWSQETCQRWPQTLGLGNGNIDMNQRPVVILRQYIPVEVVVSCGVVVGSGRCAAASSVTAAEDPVSLSPEVGEERVSVMVTADLVAASIKEN